MLAEKEIYNIVSSMENSSRSNYMVYNSILVTLLITAILAFLYIVNYSYEFSDLTGIPRVGHPPLQFVCLGVAALSFFLFILNIRKHTKANTSYYDSDVLDDLDTIPKNNNNTPAIRYAKKIFFASLGLGGLGFLIVSTTSPSGFEDMVGLPRGFAEPIVLGGLVVAGILFVLSIILFISNSFANR